MTDYTTRLGEALERMKVYSGYESPFCWEIDLFRNAAQILHRLLTEGPTNDELTYAGTVEGYEAGYPNADKNHVEWLKLVLNKAMEE